MFYLLCLGNPFTDQALATLTRTTGTELKTKALLTKIKETTIYSNCEFLVCLVFFYPFADRNDEASCFTLALNIT